MRVETRKNIITAACYSGVFILGMIVGPKFVKENRKADDVPSANFSVTGNGEKMNKILQIIHEKYVDDVKLDTLQSLTIRDILGKLDPHSTYLPPEDAQVLDEDLEGNFNGIGIGYYLLNDTLLVTSINPGGPSAHSGLQRGDRVLSINDRTIAGNSTDPKAVSAMIRGMQGTEVELLVQHPGQAENVTIKVTRGKITVSSIDAAYLPAPGTGYIKISRFGAKTNEDFVFSLEKLQRSGMKNLILDLRGNGGGYLSAATALADEFLENKKLIVYTQGLHEPRTDYLATAEGNFEQGKLVVLIDENTASASEIVAGAIQDLDRGIIVGRRSFGKGLVQEQFPFGDGSALNLTIARYYTPSGRSIQRSYKNGPEAYYDEPYTRYKHRGRSGSNRSTDSTFSGDKLFTTVSGRKVFGGGGISPDIYVAPDTSGYTDFYYDLSRKGLINDFVYIRLLKSMKPESMTSFEKNYQLSDKLYRELVQFAADKGITTTDSEQRLSRPLITNSLKAVLALYYFGDDGYYRVINENDRVMERSMEVLNGDRLTANK